MADEFGFTIEGLDECMEQLATFPTRLVKQAFGKALASAAVPIVESLAARTPTETGLLQSSIQSEILVDSEGRGGSLNIGFGVQGHVARLVETGHKAIGHAPKKTDKGNVVPPHPFMRVALATADDAATTAFQTSLLASLEDGEV